MGQDVDEPDAPKEDDVPVDGALDRVDVADAVLHSVHVRDIDAEDVLELAEHDEHCRASHEARDNGLAEELDQEAELEDAE